MNDKIQIVYARAEQTALVPTGRNVWRDMNWFPEFRADWEARAGVWLNKGTTEDVEKAKIQLGPEGYTILTFPTNERNSLEKARATVIKQALSR